jgi:hypothetical protein
MNRFQVIRALLLDDVEVQFGKLSLCDLHHYCGFRGTRRWQVFCDDAKIPHYKIYQSLDDAVIAFLELKKKLGSRVR